MKIQDVVRNAILSGNDLSTQFDEIAVVLNCPIHTAKRLRYAFIYQANEDYLQSLLNGNE